MIRTLQNSQAKLKCMQSDIFTEIKRAIKVYSKDEVVKKIIAQQYSKVNYQKSVVGLDGKPVFGVIDNVNLNKRDEIVKELLEYLMQWEQSGSVDTVTTCLNVVDLCVVYFDINKWLNEVTLSSVLENHLQNVMQVRNAVRVECHNFEKKLRLAATYQHRMN